MPRRRERCTTATDGCVQTISARGHPIELIRDAFGRIVRKVDALGHVTCLEWDKATNLHVERVFERRPDGSCALLARTENTFDQLGRLTITAQSLFEDALPVTPNVPLDSAFVVGPVAPTLSRGRSSTAGPGRPQGRSVGPRPQLRIRRTRPCRQRSRRPRQSSRPPL